MLINAFASATRLQQHEVEKCRSVLWQVDFWIFSADYSLGSLCSFHNSRIDRYIQEAEVIFMRPLVEFSKPRQWCNLHHKSCKATSRCAYGIVINEYKALSLGPLASKQCHEPTCCVPKVESLPTKNEGKAAPWSSAKSWCGSKLAIQRGRSSTGRLDLWCLILLPTSVRYHLSLPSAVSERSIFG